MYGKKILKLLQKIFSWLPLATVIDQKVLIVHGGISRTTDLQYIASLDRHRVSADVVATQQYSCNRIDDMLSVCISMFQY